MKVVYLRQSSRPRPRYNQPWQPKTYPLQYQLSVYVFSAVYFSSIGIFSLWIVPVLSVQKEAQESDTQSGRLDCNKCNRTHEMNLVADDFSESWSGQSCPVDTTGCTGCRVAASLTDTTTNNATSSSTHSSLFVYRKTWKHKVLLNLKGSRS